MAGRDIRKTVVETIEVAPGARLEVAAEQDRLLKITLPGGAPLPKGVRAVSVDGRIVLRYPDGTEITVT